MTNENAELQIVTTDALGALQRAEIDMQISTAKKYPRSMTAFKQQAIGMATIDEETAESCIYNRPVGKEGGQMKYAEGLSVRMAEIVGASYGNLRVGAMITEMSERRVVARGMAHDLQTNFAAQTEVVESTVDKYGKPYSERMRAVVAKAALAKARRDATFQVVPKALCKPVEAAARALIIGDGSVLTIAKRRDAVLKWTNTIGVPAERVFQSLGIKGPDDIGVEQLEKLTGIKTAIKEGDVTVDEAFPMPAQVKVESPNIPAGDDGDLGPQTKPTRTRKTTSDAGQAPKPATTATQEPAGEAPATASEPPSNVRTVKEDCITALLENGVSYDLFTSYLITYNIAPDARSFESFELLPSAVYDKVVGATLGKIIKLYGAKG